MRLVACTGEKRNACGISVGKPKAKRPFGCTKGRFECTIRTDITWKDVDWNNLVHDTENWWNLLNVIMNLQVQ